MKRENLGGPVDGTTVVWHEDEGRGVPSSPLVEGEVWVQFSHINIALWIR